MADKDKLEINFRDLAKDAAKYVFSSTFPSLERMLKTVQTTGEENKEQVENLSEATNTINVRLGEINVGLRKLNDAMNNSLGVLGKILKKVDGGGGDASSVLPGGGLNNIKSGVGAALGTGAMMQIIENQHAAPGPETQTQSETDNKSTPQPASSVAGQSANTAAPTADASKAGAPAGTAPSTPAPAPEKKDATGAAGGKTLLIKASTITFDAGQIIFTSGGGSGGGGQTGGGGGGATPAPSQQPSAGGGSGGGGQTGGGVDPSSGAGGENGRLNTSQLTRVPGGLLQSTAAGPYMQMVKAAGEENIAWGIGSSYRDYDTQVKVAREKGLYSQGGLAAKPGTSNHGWGTALDLDFKQNPKAYNWLQQNAGRFGFRTIPREAWHWEYKGGGASGGTMASKDDKSKTSGEGAPNDGAITASAGSSGGANKPSTGPATPAGAPPPATTAMAPKPEENKTKPTAAASVASTPAKGAELNRESTSSEVSSIAIPSRASMNNVMKSNGQQKESDIPVNPKITNANKAGNVEPDDAAQRYESLFGMKPRVPTGSTSKMAS